MAEHRVAVQQLRVGVFIRLDLKWFEHPFLFSSFKIRSADQIQTLRELGLTHVFYVPEKSDLDPLSLEQVPDALLEPTERTEGTDERLLQFRKARIQRLQERNRRLQHCEKEFTRTFGQVKSLMENMSTASSDVARQADVVVEGIVETLLAETEVVVNLMNVKSKDEGLYFHVLNVTLLALLLGREHGLDAESLRYLGVGALFHDVGKHRIPKKVLYKRGPLSVPERQLIELHSVYGEEMMAGIEGFPPQAREIIRHHHESIDGKGYPDKLAGDQIPLPAKITAIANVYDNCCNPLDPNEAMTPHEALSHMYCYRQQEFDRDLLTLFIRALGVYPPGTIVLLSNGMTGIIVSLNSGNPLRPSVLIYDPAIPKNEAVIVDLDEVPDVTINKSIRPSQLSPEVYNYLSPRTQVYYFIDTADRSSGSPHPLR